LTACCIVGRWWIRFYGSPWKFHLQSQLQGVGAINERRSYGWYPMNKLEFYS
jgi:hypothetical protein